MGNPVHIEPSRRVLHRRVTAFQASGKTDAIPLRGYQLRAVLLPDSWDGGNLTFEVATEPTGPFFTVHTEIGGIYAVTAAGGRAITFSLVLAPYDFVKIVAEDPLAEDREITAVLVASTG